MLTPIVVTITYLYHGHANMKLRSNVHCMIIDRAVLMGVIVRMSHPESLFGFSLGRCSQLLMSREKGANVH